MQKHICRLHNGECATCNDLQDLHYLINHPAPYTLAHWIDSDEEVGRQAAFLISRIRRAFGLPTEAERAARAAETWGVFPLCETY